MKRTHQRLLLLGITPIFIWSSYYLAFFAHEYAHALTAWILGYKSNPLDINYGGASLKNILLLWNVDQKVDNNLIYSLGHAGHVAMIAFAGPAITILLFFLSFFLLQTKTIRQYPYLFYFLFFFNLVNLGEMFAYVPLRIFTTQGNMVDVLDIEQSLHISPWLIYLFGTYMIIFLIWQFFAKTLVSAYFHVNITSNIGRSSLMIFCVVYLFGYCGLFGLSNPGEISQFLGMSSILAVPGMIFVLWPRRI